MEQVDSKSGASEGARVGNPTSATVAELARAVAAGTLRPSDIVEAHIERIRAVNSELNAVVFECFEDARQEAKEADRRARGGGAARRSSACL